MFGDCRGVLAGNNNGYLAQGKRPEVCLSMTLVE